MNGEGEPGGGNGKVPPFPDLLPIEWHGLRSPVGRSFEQAGTAEARPKWALGLGRVV